MLTVTVTSFSFIYGPFPEDKSGNGGGFMFDCRALPNPGRFDEFKALSGKDDAVRQYMEKETEVVAFLESVNKLVSQSVRNYQERNFSHLQVNFGCTGGQHRSVYFAERLAKYLKKHFEININLNHLREEVWG